jgi:hypothetical protein
MRTHRALAWAAAGVAAANVLFYGRYGYWAGDWAWGPRYLVPLTGMMLLPAVMVLERWRRLATGTRAAVGALIAWGFVVQVLAVSIDFIDQMLLQVNEGVNPLIYWDLAHAAWWRHANAMLHLISGGAPYPANFAAASNALAGRPNYLTLDFWWVYGWLRDAGRPLILAVVMVAATAIFLSVRELRTATRSVELAPAQ